MFVLSFFLFTFISLCVGVVKSFYFVLGYGQLAMM